MAMNADDVKRSFVDWVNDESRDVPEKLALRGGDVWILKESAPEGWILEDILVDATDEEWLTYYNWLTVSDDHAISLMWVHLGETVTKAAMYGGNRAVIDPYLRMAE